MDMHSGAPFQDANDHHEDVVSFAHATQKAEASKPVAASCGDGWYHEAAVAAAERDAVDARSNPYHH